MIRKYISYLILVLLPLFILELISLAILLGLHTFADAGYEPLVKNKLRAEHRTALRRLIAGEVKYYAFDPLLGYAITPGGIDGVARANHQGLRGDRDYLAEKAEGKLRLAAFGDSYTHGDEVQNSETWPAVLEKTNSHLEVMNFGVGGYGLDQALLRYETSARPFKPDFVLVGFMPENINRHVNVFRPFYVPHGIPLPKPRYVFQDHGWSLLPTGILDKTQLQDFLNDEPAYLKKFGARDYWYQNDAYGPSYWDVFASIRLSKYLLRHFAPEFFLRTSVEPIVKDGIYNRKSEAYRVTLFLFDKFHVATNGDGAKTIFLILPHKQDLKRYREDGKKIYEPLLQDLQERGYCLIDVMDVFQTVGRDDAIAELFMPMSHYSAKTNAYVSAAITDYFQEKKSEGCR